MNYNISMIPLGDSLVPVVMPFYEAEMQTTLERGSKPFSVVEILQEVFQEDFSKAIQMYMDECPECTAKAIGIEEVEDFQLIRLFEPTVESSLMQPKCSTAVDLIFRAVVEAQIPEDGNATLMKRKRYTTAFRLRYYISFWTRRCSAPVVAPAGGFPKDLITEQKIAVTNQYLLPIMRAEDYVKAGRRMLEEYYPEALEKPMAVNGWELAKRMDLRVRRVSYGKGSNIMGQIFFAWTPVRLRDSRGRATKEDIPPMTVLINKDNCDSPEKENTTLIHECCHVFLDLLFFMLQLLSGRPYRSYTSRKKTRHQYSEKNGPIDWMELQAEKLPAYLLMEENNTKKEIEKLLREKGGKRTPENMRYVMESLADTFKVSKSMAKYRMIELGYPEAEGIYNFINKTPVPDHGCGNAWKKGYTYTVSLPEAGALLRKSEDFANVLNSGRYSYIEGHFCLDMEPYVELNRWKEKRLSAYARYHMEDCCLAFAVRGRYTDAEYADAQAAKKEVKNKWLSRHVFLAEPGTKGRTKENTVFTEDASWWTNLKRSLPEDIGKAIQLILDKKGISQEKLAERLRVSRTALRKWCSDKMSLRHVIAVCIALDVRADVGMELVQIAGYSFKNNKEHDIYLAMLYDTKDLDIIRANEILRLEGLPPLTEGIDEAVAC